MTSLVSFTVPEGVASGDIVQLNVHGKLISVQIPKASSAGDVLEISIPTPDDDQPEDGEQDGPCYTSGDEDTTPAILTPAQWRLRYPTPSLFKHTVRPYRCHYFHNQKDGNLSADSRFDAIIDSPIEQPMERLQYTDAIKDNIFASVYCSGGPGNCGRPVMLTNIPGATATMANFTPSFLCKPFLLDPEDDRFKEQVSNKDFVNTINVVLSEEYQGDEDTVELGHTPFRICHPFDWGQRTIDGRLPLVFYFIMLTQHPKADIPFYVFENSIGGAVHTRHSYSKVDEWVRDGQTSHLGPRKQHDKNKPQRQKVASLYAVPPLFQQVCMLQVPYELRPRSTDGVLLVGSRRSGSYPHQDPSYTAAWNYLLHGVKRWVLFPPDVKKSTILGEEGEQYEQKQVDLNELPPTSEEFYKVLATKGSGYWWAEHYPRLKKRQHELGMVEVLQQPGEVIFVPPGWWHSVINVSKWTVAVTHNLILPALLVPCFQRAVVEEPLFARRWWRCLKHFAPHHAERIPIALRNDCLARSSSLLKAHRGKQMECDAFSPVLARIDDELED